MAGRLSVDGVRDEFACGRKGVEDMGNRSATSLPLLLLLLEELTGLERCDTGAESTAGREGFVSASGDTTDA